YLILPAAFEDGKAVTNPCPFCDEKHTHSPEEGHRVAHCSHENRHKAIASDGTVLSPENGYYIVERGRERGSLYEDCCPKCMEVVKPDVVYPLQKGFQALFTCGDCNHSWRTWYSKRYKDFIEWL